MQVLVFGDSDDDQDQGDEEELDEDEEYDGDNESLRDPNERLIVSFFDISRQRNANANAPKNLREQKGSLVSKNPTTGARRELSHDGDTDMALGTGNGPTRPRLRASSIRRPKILAIHALQGAQESSSLSMDVLRQARTVSLSRKTVPQPPPAVPPLDGPIEGPSDLSPLSLSPWAFGRLPISPDPEDEVDKSKSLELRELGHSSPDWAELTDGIKYIIMFELTRTDNSSMANPMSFTQAAKYLSLTYEETAAMIKLIQLENAKVKSFNDDIAKFNDRLDMDWLDSFLEQDRPARVTEMITDKEIKRGKAFLNFMGLNLIADQLGYYMGMAGNGPLEIPLTHLEADGYKHLIPHFNIACGDRLAEMQKEEWHRQKQRPPVMSTSELLVRLDPPPGTVNPRRIDPTHQPYNPATWGHSVPPEDLAKGLHQSNFEVAVAASIVIDMFDQAAWVRGLATGGFQSGSVNPELQDLNLLRSQPSFVNPHNLALGLSTNQPRSSNTPALGSGPSGTSKGNGKPELRIDTSTAGGDPMGVDLPPNSKQPLPPQTTQAVPSTQSRKGKEVDRSIPQVATPQSTLPVRGIPESSRSLGEAASAQISSREEPGGSVPRCESLQTNEVAPIVDSSLLAALETPTIQQRDPDTQSIVDEYRKKFAGYLQDSDKGRIALRRTSNIRKKKAVNDDYIGSGDRDGSWEPDQPVKKKMVGRKLQTTAVATPGRKKKTALAQTPANNFSSPHDVTSTDVPKTTRPRGRPRRTILASSPDDSEVDAPSSSSLQSPTAGPSRTLPTLNRAAFQEPPSVGGVNTQLTSGQQCLVPPAPGQNPFQGPVSRGIDNLYRTNQQQFVVDPSPNRISAQGPSGFGNENLHQSHDPRYDIGGNQTKFPPITGQAAFQGLSGPRNKVLKETVQEFMARQGLSDMHPSVARMIQERLRPGETVQSAMVRHGLASTPEEPVNKKRKTSENQPQQLNIITAPSLFPEKSKARSNRNRSRDAKKLNSGVVTTEQQQQHVQNSLSTGETPPVHSTPTGGKPPLGGLGATTKTRTPKKSGGKDPALLQLHLTTPPQQTGAKPAIGNYGATTGGSTPRSSGGKDPELLARELARHRSLTPSKNSRSASHYENDGYSEDADGEFGDDENDEVDMLLE
ncbi:hypothetical protein B0H63DRAFT_557212 [Podospora didyma]|uniref:Uncharacterized protein n=1 Tax=Podospora didyma TaxID=330526 RepID=A0AAE0NYW3_9PEZI|nr:hypothetical protein B0H63DRAFT_557212 [Podospora didyma]